MKQVLFFLFLFFPATAFSENYLLNGGQESEIKYTLEQSVTPTAATRKLVLSYVIPAEFISPTYSQKIENLQLKFTPTPLKKEKTKDKRGNNVITLTWKSPLETVKTVISLTALNKVNLQKLQAHAVFPLKEIPKEVWGYLEPTEQVQSGNENIVTHAKKLTKSSVTEFDAVQKILTWIVDHMRYILIPKSYDAIYSFHSGKGNCQNYSHLAAALMRSVGIPVRIVNGIALKEPYDIKTDKEIITLKMAQGRHSWIEVYFSDLGWIPFDPAGTELFVSNRFIRVEVGIDNNETDKDGLIRWSQVKGKSGRPQFIESINADFVNDSVLITAQKKNYGPKGLLLSPEVEAAFVEVKVEPPIHEPFPEAEPEPEPTPEVKPGPEPEKTPDPTPKKPEYTIPFLYGNLEFPENLDFLSVNEPPQEEEGGTLKMRKNFVVETAEYVTDKGQQYAQTFILQQPIILQKVGLALHKFNNEGQLWLELLKDDNGKPGEYIANSDLIQLNEMKYTHGYSWVDFDFAGSSINLKSGRYWIALGFTGSPIANWFFSYGKPIGPLNGTRYKKMFDPEWSRSLAFEFNYRVAGLSAE